MKFNDIMKEVLDNNKRESFKEAIEKLVFVDNETAKDAEDILKKYPSATRVKCTRMQRTLLFDNVKDKETAKAQLTDNGINGLSKQSLSSENFKEAANNEDLYKLKKDLQSLYDKYYSQGYRGMSVDSQYMSGSIIDADLSQYPKKKVVDSFKVKHNLDLNKYGINLKNNEVIWMGNSHIYIGKKESLSSDNSKESYNASKLKSEYDKLLNSDMTTSDLQSALSVVVKSMFNYMDASYRDEIENVLLQGLQASKQFSSIKMSIESKVGNYGLVHGR